MVKMNKILTIVLIVVILGAVFFLLIPAWSNAGRMDVTFYDVDGQEVHIPYSLVPYGIVTSGGQEVVSFSITVHWLTSDPGVNEIDWGVGLKVHYVTVDSIPPETATSWEGVLWVGHSYSASWDNGAGSQTSPLFDIHTYCNDVPGEKTFYMEFYGDFRFLVTYSSGTHEPHSSDVVFEGVFTPHTMTCYHDGYEYEAWFGT
ncbi:MAG: hypothetical protein ACXADB_08895 [Candidatus Hermodarchaeia archaeon]|jgi:hypothetical protein